MTRRWCQGPFLLLVVLLAAAACTRVSGVPSGPAPASGGDPSGAPSLDPGPDAVPGPPGAPEAGEERAAGTPVREVRALWVVRTTLVHPDSVRAMVSRAADSGFTTLLVQVRGRGDAFYVGGPEPRSPLLAGTPADYDPLALVVEEGHRRGLEVHAWVNTHLVSSAVTLPREPGHLVNARPEWLALPLELARRLHGVPPSDRRYLDALAAHARQNRDRIEGLYSSPLHPGVSDHVVAVWRHLLENYDLDGVHLDYMRFASPEFDHSPAALAAFRAHVLPRVAPERRAALDRAAERDPLAWVEALPGEWVAFREGAVSGLVERISAEVRALRPGIVISAAVFPGRDAARRDRFQDWGLWAEQGWVDVIAPMTYTADPGRYREQVRDAVALAGGDRVWAGVGIYQTSFPGALEQAGIARREGAAGLALFSYDWAVSEGTQVASGSYLDLFARRFFPSGGGIPGR